MCRLADYEDDGKAAERDYFKGGTTAGAYPQHLMITDLRS